MKQISLTVAIFLTLGALPLFAQTQDADVNNAIEVTRSVLQTQKKAIIANAMELTGEESNKFWPVYRDYQTDLKKVNDRTVKLITDYAMNYDMLKDQQAKSMVDEFLSIEKAELKLKKSYVKKFRKVLPPRKVARYFQIENKIDAVIRVELAQDIPLVP